MQSKLHPSLLAIVDRLKNPKLAASADEAKFVRDGKAEVQIWLTEKSEATLAKLKALGFEVVLDPKSAKLVIGRLSIEQAGGARGDCGGALRRATDDEVSKEM